MDTFTAFTSAPFAAASQIDHDANDSDGCKAFYGADGEAKNVDHRQFPDGAAFGPYIPVSQLRGRRIAPSR